MQRYQNNAFRILGLLPTASTAEIVSRANEIKVKILDTKEVAQLLRLSEEYVRELIREKKIKAYKEGRRGGYRITMKEVENYIERKHEAMETSVK